MKHEFVPNEGGADCGECGKGAQDPVHEWNPRRVQPDDPPPSGPGKPPPQ